MEPLPTGTLAIVRGTRVCCENQHHLCTLADDLHYGDANYAGKFEWNIPDPTGHREIYCPTCGQCVWRDGNFKRVWLYPPEMPGTTLTSS